MLIPWLSLASSARLIRGKNGQLPQRLQTSLIKKCNQYKISKLPLINNYLRTTVTYERLNALCLLAVESSVLKVLQFNELAKDFADAKCMKRDIFCKYCSLM